MPDATQARWIPPEVEMRGDQQVAAWDERGKPYPRYIDCSEGCGFVIGVGDAVETVAHDSCLARSRSSPDDEAVFAEAFVLADAVRRFLGRASTRNAITAGLLDSDVVDALSDSSSRMTMLRRQRRDHAVLGGETALPARLSDRMPIGATVDVWTATGVGRGWFVYAYWTEPGRDDDPDFYFATKEFDRVCLPLSLIVDVRPSLEQRPFEDTIRVMRQTRTRRDPKPGSVNSDSFSRLGARQQRRVEVIAEVLRKTGGYRGSKTDSVTDAVAIVLALAHDE